VPVWFPILTVNMRPSLLPQTSHAPMVPASCLLLPAPDNQVDRFQAFAA